MDDTSAPRHDSEAIELRIHEELKKNKSPASIAAGLLEDWDHPHFLLSAKSSAAFFCLRFGLETLLLNRLLKDLAADQAMPWAAIIALLMRDANPKSAGDVSAAEGSDQQSLSDALFEGASRDKQLHQAAAAVTHQFHDPRWAKILNSENNERVAEAKKRRDEAFHELQIFRTEGMLEELRESIAKILKLFPDDAEVLAVSNSMGERDIASTLDRLRKFKERRRPKDQVESWPELTSRLRTLKPSLDLDSAYHLSIALHQMGLFSDALSILKSKKGQWRTREKLWELELLVSQGHFAETLGITQRLMHQSVEDADTLRAVLYYTAKAYRGLEDNEQAISILKGILKYEPNYRDADVLLVEWETE